MEVESRLYRIVKWAVDQNGSFVRELTIFEGSLEEMNKRYPKNTYSFSTVFFNDSSRIMFLFQVWHLLRWKTILDPRQK